MSFLGLIRRKGLFGITWGTPGAGSWESAYQWVRGLDTLRTGAQVNEPYRQHSVIGTAISILAGDAASVGWELYPEGNRDDAIETHPFLTFLEKPNAMMSGHQMHVGSYVSWFLFGECWWYYPEVNIGRADALRASRKGSGSMLLLDPRRISLNDAGAWQLKTGSGYVVLDQDSLTQFKRFNPYNPVRGLSVIDSLRIEIEGDVAAATYNKTFFADQGGVPRGLLIPGENAQGTKDDRKDFEARFNREAESGRRFVAVAPPGWSWTDIGVSPKDMEFKTLREYSREQILAAFGVPPFMAGVLDKANYANAREQRETYWLGTITRFLTDIAATINADVMPKLGVTGVELCPAWETVKALTENLSEKVDVAGKLFAMGWPKRAINDRLELGMDVDELEDADVGYVPFSVTPVSFALAPPVPAPVTQPTDESLDEEPEDGKSMRRAKSPSGQTARTLVWKALVARTRDIELRFNASIRGHMEKIEKEVLANLNGIKGWRAVSTKAPGDVGDILFDLNAAIRDLIRASSPLHKQGMVRGGESILADLAVGSDFDLSDPRAIAKLSELTGRITNVDRTLEAQLRASLSEGLTGGESVDQLAKRVRDVMAAGKARSMTIARTETGAAFNSGRHVALQEAGVEREEWLTSRDSSVRDSHAEIDGEVVRTGEPFSNGLIYPQDPSGPAEEVINCRCVLLPVVSEAE